MTSDPYLFAELLLTQLVERVELLGEHHVLQEAAAGQFDADDDGAIRHHHGHRTEVDLQILRQFLTSGVTGVLCAEEKRGI